MKDELLNGVNAVLEALRGKRRAFELFVAEGVDERRLERLLALAAEQGVPVRRRRKDDLSKLCGSQHHQGVVLRLEPFPYTAIEDIIATVMEQTRDGLVVVLDGIQDPHNLGAVIRTASCAGADGVVIPQDRAARVTAVVEKSSAGGAETIPIARVPNIAATLKLLKEAGFWVYGLVDTAATPLPIQDLTGRVALVIGSEGEGIRPLVAKHCDGLLAIPLRQGVGTLNASVAAGIALYDVIRQRETWREKE